MNDSIRGGIKEGVDEEKKRAEFILEAERALRRRISEERLSVVLLGASGRGLEARRRIAEHLAKDGITALVPEDDFPGDIALSLSNRILLSADTIDLVFVNVQSWGSTAEFSEFSSQEVVVGKLRVLVARRFHPIYGSTRGYLTDAYLTHEAVHGHVYIYREEDEPDEPNWLPTPLEVTTKIAERYKQWKALR